MPQPHPSEPASASPAPHSGEQAADRHPSAEELRWQTSTLAPALAKSPERPIGSAQNAAGRIAAGTAFTTISGTPVERLYTQADLPEDWRARQDKYLGLPGQPPYTRGLYPEGYRGRLWTMRQFSGFASPEETNRRYKSLLAGGAGGLSVAFDLPTLMGRDSDDPLSEGEVGKCGVAIDSVDDMETLFSGIDLASTTVSMTINSPAGVLWAMYLVAAERQGADWTALSGTLQNDILKEYIAQKEYLYPPEPSMRLVVDTFEFAARRVPRFNPVSISGYHIREAGSTALQELAFTLYDGVEYVEWALRRGLSIDDFAPRLSFFFNAHNDFFEEIAKYRAARRLWYRLMTERFGASNPRSAWMRFHTQTAGVSLTAQQPKNNIARVALQALAAVLGGTQSLHTDAFDEALALPTEDAARIALRTQQILAHESGVADVADPFAGSYFVEKLTLDMERDAWNCFDKLDAMGGMVRAIEKGWPQKEIAEASYAYQRAVETREKIIVGINDYVIDEPPPQTLYIGESVREAQTLRLKALRAGRSNEAVERTLSALCRAAEQQPEPAQNGALSAANTMPFLLDCVRARATVGEICAALTTVFGAYQEPGIS
ncbi:acyl-CoA mutase large subunit family protein [Paracidobacterium acidisoli]|uniref:Methylmalonyl-CoA mutase n=1 Tax=Paracidobacterium acidisoli TaxID=2303751 RepID=A0A372IRW2_9BACT|nr:methylmalonyl-CoA mutase family protein [Paracidobacterium acidisoli]MBT9330553.1 methylmalonyl-CoA mutase family protein [Paracidobacterium acidisoli]